MPLSLRWPLETVRMVKNLIICVSALVVITWSSQSQSNQEISVTEVLQPSIRHGDILAILNLKKQQNKSLQRIAKCMNDSFGIVMNPFARTRRNRTEIRLEWIGNRSIKAGIKIKYLGKAFPNIYIHQLFGDFNHLPGWEYVNGIYLKLIDQNDGYNIILNQIGTYPTICNYPFTSESLVFPIYMTFNQVIRRMDWNNTADIMEFLSNEFNFIRPDLLEMITGKLILSKRVHKIRKKVWPRLLSMHKVRRGLNMTKVESLVCSKELLKIQKCLNDLKTQKEYKAFFIAMKVVVASVCMEKIKEITGGFDWTQSFLKLQGEVRAADLMSVYPHIHLNGDVHVLCLTDAHWDFSLIRSKLLMVFNKVPRYQGLAKALSELIVKVVVHPNIGPSC